MLTPNKPSKEEIVEALTRFTEAADLNVFCISVSDIPQHFTDGDLAEVVVSIECHGDTSNLFSDFDANDAVA